MHRGLVRTFAASEKRARDCAAGSSIEAKADGGLSSSRAVGACAHPGDETSRTAHKSRFIGNSPVLPSNSAGLPRFQRGLSSSRQPATTYGGGSPRVCAEKLPWLRRN